MPKPGVRSVVGARLWLRGGLPAAAVALLAGPGSVALAQTPPSDGGLFEWRTIGAVGNAPYMGTPAIPSEFGTGPIGRGQVNYEYRIARTELTVGQWVAFMNAVASNPSTLHVYDEIQSRIGNQRLFRDVPAGAGQDMNYTGPGIRYLTTPASARLPVEVSWFDAAIICNWLNNGRPSDASQTLTGAYDTASWHLNPNFSAGGNFNRLPGAQFFIPTQDEWMKAAHYDPHRYGTNLGGYWLQSYSSDTPVTWALPENGGGAYWAFHNGVRLSVDAFPTVQSPWGLTGTASLYGEFFEPRGGAASFPNQFAAGLELVGGSFGSPWEYNDFTVRIASVIPTCSGTAILLSSLVVCSRRRRVEATR